MHFSIKVFLLTIGVLALTLKGSYFIFFFFVKIKKTSVWKCTFS